MTPQELAQKVTSFIQHNNIDTNNHSMEEIVAAYFNAQMEAIEIAGKKLAQERGE